MAAIYGVQTRTLNQAVKRNTDRFPGDFMFQLAREEVLCLRSQIVILNKGRGQHLKYLPYAFTEHGAIQAANILSSPRAVEMEIYVVRAFIKLREVLASNKELAQKLDQLERKLQTHDQAIIGILKTIREHADLPGAGLEPARSFLRGIFIPATAFAAESCDSFGVWTFSLP